MYKLIFGFLLLGSLQSTAQTQIEGEKHGDTYITNTSVYTKGIYQTFEEFKYNRPSIVANYTFHRKNLWLTDEQTGKKKKINKEEIWGFCDGSRIYVSWGKYNELLEMGRYCYFIEKGTRIVFGLTASLLPLPIPIPYKEEVIVNFNTGRTSLLSKKLLKTILAEDDEELLNEYMNETQKGKKFFEYIMKYNDRNFSKIK